MIFHWKNLIILFLLTFTTGFIAGFYPAFVLSSVDPIKALRNSTIQKSGHWNFRNNMTVIQFVISITLIICTIIIYQQLVFFQNKSLGFDKENVIILSTESNAAKQNIEVFRNSLIQDSRIISITSTSNTLGNDIFWDTNFRRDDTDEFYNLLLLQTDYDFVRTYNIPFLQGRNFSRDHGTDKQQAFIINEQAAL